MGGPAVFGELDERVEHLEGHFGRYGCFECQECGARSVMTIEYWVKESGDRCPACGVESRRVPWEPSTLQMVLNDRLNFRAYSDALELVEEDGIAVVTGTENREVFRVTAAEGDA